MNQTSQEQVIRNKIMNKSWTCQEQVTVKKHMSWTCHKLVIVNRIMNSDEHVRKKSSWTKTWASHEHVMNKSLTSHEQVIMIKSLNNSWTSHERVTNKSWPSHEVNQSLKYSGTSHECHEWTSHKQVMNKSSTSHEPIMNPTSHEHAMIRFTNYHIPWANQSLNKEQQWNDLTTKEGTMNK